LSLTTELDITFDMKKVPSFLPSGVPEITNCLPTWLYWNGFVGIDTVSGPTIDKLAPPVI
jgi:hypothetical protein